MPPRKLASLFGPLLFGLADDQPFDQTYQEWQRTTDATEHLLLAFVRDQQAHVGQLPTKLARFVEDYPVHLNVGYGAHEPPRVARGARVEEVLRVRRLTRFHSRNLVQSAGSWEVPGGREWGLFFPPGAQADSGALVGNGAAGQVLPTYTAYYRHLLNIRHNPLLDDDDDLGEMQRELRGWRSGDGIQVCSRLTFSGMAMQGTRLWLRRSGRCLGSRASRTTSRASLSST